MQRPLPPDPAWLHHLLVRAGTLERGREYLVQPLAGNQGRADARSRRTFLVWQGKMVLFHVTVGKGLRTMLRRQIGFAGQFPDLTCHPLFLLQKDGVDVAGREYFPGQNLEDALRSGELEAPAAAAIIDEVLGQLAAATRPSTPTAALKELAALGEELLVMKTWSDTDRLYLREIALPFLREHLGDGPFQRRWTNGDFIAKNLLVSPAKEVRLIDYELAARTHFFADDQVRFLAHSRIPETVKRGVRAVHRPPTRFATLYSLLNHARVSERILSPDLARFEIAAVAGQIAQVIASEPGRRGHFLASPGQTANSSTTAGALVEAKIYWSESGAFAEEASTVLTYAPGRLQQLTVDLPAMSAVRYLRIDPAERVGVVHVTGIVVRSLVSLEPLWQTREPSIPDEIQVGGSALQLPTNEGLALLSTGDDPWFVLPPLDRVMIEALRVELSLRFDDARVGIERAAAEIVALREIVSAHAPQRPTGVNISKKRSLRAAR